MEVGDPRISWTVGASGYGSDVTRAPDWSSRPARIDVGCTAPTTPTRSTEVFHIDGFEDETDGCPREGDVGLQVAWGAALTENPTGKVNSAIDLAVWLEPC